MVASMAVMAREAWTDERLDDLRDDMNRRFDGVDRRFEEVKGEIAELRTEMNSMQRTMVIGFVSLFASIVVSVLGATLVTQL